MTEPTFTRHQAARNPKRLAALDTPRSNLYAAVSKLDSAALSGDLEALELAVLETENAMRELMQRVTELNSGRVEIGKGETISSPIQVNPIIGGWVAHDKTDPDQP